MARRTRSIHSSNPTKTATARTHRIIQEYIVRDILPRMQGSENKLTCEGIATYLRNTYHIKLTINSLKQEVISVLREIQLKIPNMWLVADRSGYWVTTDVNEMITYHQNLYGRLKGLQDTFNNIRERIEATGYYMMEDNGTMTWLTPQEQEEKWYRTELAISNGGK